MICGNSCSSPLHCAAKSSSAGILQRREDEEALAPAQRDDACRPMRHGVLARSSCMSITPVRVSASMRKKISPRGVTTFSVRHRHARPCGRTASPISANSPFATGNQRRVRATFSAPACEYSCSLPFSIATGHLIRGRQTIDAGQSGKRRKPPAHRVKIRCSAGAPQPARSSPTERRFAVGKGKPRARRSHERPFGPMVNRALTSPFLCYAGR